MPVWTPPWRLLVALLVVTWLGPVVYWNVVGDKAAQQPEPEVSLDTPADVYYAMSDRRYYAMVYTNSVPIFHNLGDSPVKLMVETAESPISENLPAGQRLPVPLQAGKQVFIAEDSAGQRATLGVHYLPYASSGLLLTRTVTLSLSGLSATAIYVAEASTESVPRDFDGLIAGEVEPGLFIKRVFYPGDESDTSPALSSQPPVTHTAGATPSMAFTGGEFSTIYPADIHVAEGRMRVTLEARAGGWRYDQTTVPHLLGVSAPGQAGFTQVTLLYDQGMVREPDPFPNSWSGHELVWVNPAAPIRLAYDPAPAPTTTAEVRNLARAVVNRMRPALRLVGNYHFFFSLLTTLAAPLLPLAWLWRLRKRDLAGIWPRLATPLRLSVLLWLGPLGAMFLAFGVYDSLSQASAALWAALWVSSLAVVLLSCPATFPRLTARLVTRFGRRKALAWTGWLLLMVGLAALSWMVLAGQYRMWRHPLTLPLEGLLLALAGWSLASPLTGRERGLAVSRLAWFAWTALLILLSIPLPETVYLFDRQTGWPVETGRYVFLQWGFFVLPYLSLLGSLLALKEPGDVQRPLAGLSQLVFVFLVGFTGAFPQVLPGQAAAVSPFWLSPIPFILAWVAFRLIARPAPAVQVGAYVHHQRKELLGYAIESRGVIRDVVLAFGSRPSDWDNGQLGARYGLLLGGLLALLYGVLLLPSAADQLNTPFLPLVMLVAFILPIFLRWTLAGFFLGYCFACLPGRSGAIKGFWLAVAVASAVFGYDLLFRVRSIADFRVFFATDVVLTLLGLMAVGAVLDYHTLRQAGFTWRQLLALYRVPYLAGYASTLLAAISSAIVDLITGRVTAMVSNLADAIFRVAGS